MKIFLEIPKNVDFHVSLTENLSRNSETKNQLGDEVREKSPSVTLWEIYLILRSIYEKTTNKQKSSQSNENQLKLQISLAKNVELQPKLTRW